jgi:hypothetical protein
MKNGSSRLLQLPEDFPSIIDEVYLHRIGNVWVLEEVNKPANEEELKELSTNQGEKSETGESMPNDSFLPRLDFHHNADSLWQSEVYFLNDPFKKGFVDLILSKDQCVFPETDWQSWVDGLREEYADIHALIMKHYPDENTRLLLADAYEGGRIISDLKASPSWNENWADKDSWNLEIIKKGNIARGLQIHEEDICLQAHFSGFRIEYDFHVVFAEE